MSADASGLAAVLERARAFVAARGDPLARVRLAVLLGEGSRAELLGALERGFGPAGVAGDAHVLAVLDAAGALDAPQAVRAAAALAAAQGPDGSWSPGPSADGDPLARLVTTGLVAALLARTAHARPTTLRRAAAFLAAHWGPERVQGGDFGAIAAHAAFYANAPDELSDAALQWCGRELERAFRSGGLDALRAARVLTLCDARSLPGARLDAGELVLGLVAEQRADGGWLDPALPDAWRVAATLEAALALARLAGAGGWRRAG